MKKNKSFIYCFNLNKNSGIQLQDHGPIIESNSKMEMFIKQFTLHPSHEITPKCRPDEESPQTLQRTLIWSILFARTIQNH